MFFPSVDSKPGERVEYPEETRTLRQRFDDALARLDANDPTLIHLDLRPKPKSGIQFNDDDLLHLAADNWDGGSGDGRRERREKANPVPEKTADSALNARAILEEETMDGSTDEQKAYTIGPEETQQLAQALANNTYLRSLDLQGNSIGAEGVKSLLGVLGSDRNSTLQSLNITKNGLDHQLLSSIGEFLRLNQTVRELHIGNCNYNHHVLIVAAMKKLGEGLTVNTTLEVLVMNCRLPENDSIYPIISAIETNTALRTLVLNNNIIWSFSFIIFDRNNKESWPKLTTQFQKSLLNNRTLNKLSFAGTKFDPDTLHIILQAISDANSIHYLEVGSQDYQQRTEKLLSNILKRKRERETIKKAQVPAYALLCCQLVNEDLMRFPPELIINILFQLDPLCISTIELCHIDQSPSDEAAPSSPRLGSRG
ncbi:MAG: hypothetical protein CMF50_09765 [Legionellales bacterium]|nr:hypothetical protein [Legionellales bacterium]|tara:strand:+ start:14627 stop:15904 length:1278 start_codon:yes stop_codon:yes gene_type:complete